MKPIVFSVATLILAFGSISLVNLDGCNDGDFIVFRSQGPSFLRCETPSSVPSGSILLITSGSCPSGYTEETSLNDKTLLGTLVASANIGTTGGNNNITPTGTNSVPTFTGTAFSTVINHTHTISINDPGHTHTETNNSATTGPNVGWGAQDTSTNTQSTTGYSTLSATTGVTASSNNPADGVANITPAGTVSTPAFTGDSFDNRSAFVRVIFCRKT